MPAAPRSPAAQPSAAEPTRTPRPEDGETPKDDATYLDGALVTAGAVAAENSDPDTAAGASAPLSKPALASAPQGEDGPLVSEADPTSNAG